jgi:hypothetical protein
MYKTDRVRLILCVQVYKKVHWNMYKLYLCICIYDLINMLNLRCPPLYRMLFACFKFIYLYTRVYIDMFF